MCNFDPALITEDEREFINVNGIGGEGKKIPVKAHGLNNVSDTDNFLDLHAQMPIPILNNYYKDEYGLSLDDIRKVCYHYHRYQGALRASLRKHEDRNHKFFFGDKPTAEYFASKLDPSVNVRMSKLSLRLGDLPLDTKGKAAYSNKVSESPAEQKNRSKDRIELYKLNPQLTEARLEKLLNELRDMRRMKKESGDNTRITMKVYEDLLSKNSP
jgi:hypothetical protein